jgi:ketosteroid isomerase-like protein
MSATRLAPRSVDLDLLRDISLAFNTHDVDRTMSFFAEDATFLMATGPEPTGRAVRGKTPIREVLATRFSKIPDMHRAREYEYVTPPDRAVTVSRVIGKSTDDVALNFQGCDLYEFRDGLIINKDTYCKQVTA